MYIYEVVWFDLVSEDVAVEAEVVQATTLLVRVNFGEDLVRVALLCPLLLQQLAQIDGLQGRSLRCLLYHVIQGLFFSLVVQASFAGQVLPSLLSFASTLHSFHVFVLLRNKAQLLHDLSAIPRQSVQVFDTVAHLLNEEWIVLQLLLNARSRHASTHIHLILHHHHHLFIASHHVVLLVAHFLVDPIIFTWLAFSVFHAS